MAETIIVFSAKYLLYIELLAFVLFILFARRRVRIRLFIMSAIALPLAYILGRVAGYFWYDTRPFVESGLAPLVEHAVDNGFPSDHTLLAATMATLVMLRNPWLGAGFWVLTIALGTARILAHLHHTVDIIGSIIIGLIAGSLAFYLVVLRPMRRK